MDPQRPRALDILAINSNEYPYSWGVRGDNQPEKAQYLGYLLAKDLYPDLKYTPFETYVKSVLEGSAKAVYATKKWE